MDKNEFKEYAEENLCIWDANAQWWDDRIGDGNEFQTLLIEPATEKLLEISPGDVILDVACGAGRFSRRMADLGARIVAFDCSRKFIERARERTAEDSAIEYHVLDSADTKGLLALGSGRFRKAVCTMALMDMPEIEPLFFALNRLLVEDGILVFSVIHPCFHSAAIQRFSEIYEEEAGRHVIRNGVKISRYLYSFARKSEGIIGQPEPQFYFHRPLQAMLRVCFDAGFVMTGLEEPGYPKPDKATDGTRWSDMPEIPPVLVARMKLGG